MTTTLIDLDRNPWPKAADVIDELGWTKGAMKDGRGRVCLTGAIRECMPVPGDWAIVREVANHRKHGETWNDDSARRKPQVLSWLRKDATEITDEELLTVFGPQWEEIVALVRRAATLTSDERNRYWEACQATPGWWDAWRAVIVYDGPGYAARRALMAFVGVVSYAGVGAALARRHEIGSPGGISQEHYDTLCKPWVQVTGVPVHPEDVAT